MSRQAQAPSRFAVLGLAIAVASAPFAATPAWAQAGPGGDRPQAGERRGGGDRGRGEDRGRSDDRGRGDERGRGDGGPRGDGRGRGDDARRGDDRGRGPAGDRQRWYDGAHGLNRYYPRPGYVTPSLPSRARSVYWGGASYRYWDGIWWTPGVHGYVVVRPPFGIVVADRPAFYSLVTIGAIAYLYANGVYYREHPGGGYEVVPPPVEGGVVDATAPRSFVYPRQGQTAAQQATDEYECHQWAVGQTGFDPTHAATGQPTAVSARGDYERARGACLDARGYTVR